MKSSEKTFEKAFDKAYGSLPRLGDVVPDVVKYKNMMKETGDEENNEATGSGSSGQYSQPLFSEEKEETNEEKESKLRDRVEKLLKEKLGRKPTKEEVDKVYLKAVKKLYDIAKKEKEDAKKVEATEATTSGSVGAYETPAAWAKSTKKKDFRGASKTQIPGGSFVSVKKKCKSFPYCNQGDIKALNIYKNESLKEAIKSVSKKLNISEITIKAILEYELEKINKLS